MNNLSWIKNLYLYEEGEGRGNKEKVVLAIVSIVIGAVLSSKKHSIWPIGICLFVTILTYFLSAEHPLFRSVRYFVFVVFQTINLIVLTVLFYFLITPLALGRKFFSESDSFFKNKSKNTIEVVGTAEHEFERLF